MTASWRFWLYAKLQQNPVASLLPGGVISTMEDAPETRPFAVIRIAQASPAVPGAERSFATIWVHDDPGSYINIDTILATLREQLEGPVADLADGIAARWTGDSPDLADDDRGTVVRNATYELAGRR